MIKKTNMTTIFRLTETIVVVDGINCELSYDGRYYPMRDDLANVSVFSDIIDNFLVAEESIRKGEFEEELDNILYDSGISNENLND